MRLDALEANVDAHRLYHCLGSVELERDVEGPATRIRMVARVLRSSVPLRAALRMTNQVNGVILTVT